MSENLRELSLSCERWVGKEKAPEWLIRHFGNIAADWADSININEQLIRIRESTVPGLARQALAESFVDGCFVGLAKVLEIKDQKFVEFLRELKAKMRPEDLGANAFDPIQPGTPRGSA